MNPDALTMFSKKEVTQKTKIKVGVGIFIIDDQGRILLERRKDCGMWGLPGGKIDIDISSREDNVIISVTDNGPGISEQVSEKIFDAFFSTKTSQKGTGLGLAVSRKMIQKCGGELLLAERKVQNGGAKFVIKLINGDKKGKYYV